MMKLNISFTVSWRSIHQDNISVQCIPPYTPFLYSKTRVCRGILILLQNIECGYSLEPPQRSINVLGNNTKNIQENMSVPCIHPYTPLLYSKTGVWRGIHIFLIFAPKHRLWILVRTASLRQFITCTHNLCFEQK